MGNKYTSWEVEYIDMGINYEGNGLMRFTVTLGGDLDKDLEIKKYLCDLLEEGREK